MKTWWESLRLDEQIGALGWGVATVWSFEAIWPLLALAVVAVIAFPILRRITP